MFCYVYILQSKEYKEYYIGCTKNLQKRLQEHNQGKTQSTKRYVPWRLIYYEACLDKKDAERREKYFKTSQGRRFFKRRIKEYLFNNK